MSVRPATLQDIDAIVSLLGEMRGHPVVREEIAVSLEKIVASNDRDVLLVGDDESLGLAIVNIVHKLPKREVRVDEVIVSEAARGRGLGTTLMRSVEDWAVAHDADFIEFTSRPGREAANHLYQKLGYDLRQTNVYRKSCEELKN